MYRAVHASAARQCGIGGIDDGVYRDLCDIPNNELNLSSAAGQSIWGGVHTC